MEQQVDTHMQWSLSCKDRGPDAMLGRPPSMLSAGSCAKLAAGHPGTGESWEGSGLSSALPLAPGRHAQPPEEPGLEPLILDGGHSRGFFWSAAFWIRNWPVNGADCVRQAGSELGWRKQRRLAPCVAPAQRWLL